MTTTLRRTLTAALAAALPLLPACAGHGSTVGHGTAAAAPGELALWGTLREALRDGHDEGRVALADVVRPGTWGVGALEGLAGEVSVLDGEVWVSRGSAAGVTTTREAGGDQATVLFLAEVDGWTEHTVEADVDPSVLDAWIADRAREAGLDTGRALPFVVEGRLHHLRLHVLGGECPTRARMLGATMQTPPYELHEPDVAGRLVGIYARDAAGIVCHAGSDTHVHAVVIQTRPGPGQDVELTGHVESVGLAAGAKLLLPRR